MLKNYLISTLRKTKRNLGVHLFNIIGLSIGLALSFLILIYLIHETGFDKQHKNRDQIFRLICNFHPEGSEPNYTISYIEDGFVQKLKNEFPEIEKITGIYKISEDDQIRYHEKLINEPNIRFADPEVLDIFTFELLKGEKKDLLVNNFDVLITETKSNTYFKNENPIGKTLTLETENDTILLTVKGVIKDFPVNSTFKFDFVGLLDFNYRGNNVIYSEETYLLLNQKTKYKELEKKLPVTKYDDGTVMVSSYTLQPLNDIYFNSDFIHSYSKRTGNKTNVYILSIIALAILLVSINNYTLFSIFDTKSIIKEIAIRKTAGALLKELQFQQLIASFINASISFIVALLITYFLIPWWNQYFEVDLYSMLFNRIDCFVGMLIIAFLTAFITGLYISLYISRLNPLTLFQSSFFSVKRKNVFHKIIITFQILLFVSLISFSLLVKNQINFAINKDLGYDKENLLVVDFSNKEIKDKYQAFKKELYNLPFIKEVSAINNLIPNSKFSLMHFPKYNDRSGNAILNIISVDKNFFRTMSIPLANGNSEQNAFANKNAFIINETAAKELGINIDSKLPIDLIGDGYTFTIDKICRDFDIQSVNYQHAPLAIYLKESPLDYILVKLNNQKPDDALKQIESLYTKIVSKDCKFNAKYQTEYIGNSYKKDKLFLDAIAFGTLITIFIAVLGLFNVSLLILKSRTKEILLRKVVGANVLSILKLLLSEEMSLVIGANIVAIPFTIIVMNKWLQNYAQHIDITSGIFVISFSLSVIIMFIISAISMKIVFGRSVITELNKE